MDSTNTTWLIIGAAQAGGAFPGKRPTTSRRASASTWRSMISTTTRKIALDRRRPTGSDGEPRRVAPPGCVAT